MKSRVADLGQNRTGKRGKVAAVNTKATKPPIAAPIAGPAAWLGAEMARSDAWIHTFSAVEIAELEAACAGVLDEPVPLIEVEAQAFPLPTLGPVLKTLRDEIQRGRGFVLLRGLPVMGWSIEQVAAVYWGIGAHLGRAVSQNAQGHLLGHVIDLGRSDNDPSARVYQTNARQYYHADQCDIVGLLCLRKARRGGSSTIVSAVSLYNEMLAHHPHLLEELLQPFCVDRRGEVPPGANPWYELPVFCWCGGELVPNYSRRYMTSAQRFEGVPPFTKRQIEAFDQLDALADDPDMHLSMDFEPGDIQLLNNLQILHDRTAFEDWPEPERRRHLLRLWLCTPTGRPLPPEYAQAWHSVEPGNRGGILVKGVKLQLPLTPT